MPEMTLPPLCGSRKIHEPHYEPHADRQCPGWTPEQNGVWELMGAIWGLRLDRVTIDPDRPPVRLVCHGAVLNAIRRNILPSFSDLQATPGAHPDIGVVVEIDTGMAPGQWQLVAAEGVIP